MPFPLESCEQIVDFFRGMNLRRKRIVYFVVEQVAALFAHGNELAYRIVFLFKAYCCHKFLPLLDRNPQELRHAGNHLFRRDARRLARRRKLRGNFPRRSLAF